MRKKVLIGGVLCIVVIGSILIYVVSRYQNTSAERLPDKYGANIEQIHSKTDKDQDNIDDQTDILESTFSYIASKPEYKSKYYQTGYSDDEYGVCTDVVANALKNAGYDLMVLIQEDIKKNPDEYDIDEPDINIDFRRVKNLKVYFSHKAISLTTDIYNIKEWQGGDIVIFKNHIGIVSDRRNENGVPYVIHHNDPWQRAYEQDILETRNDIAGHYRITE